MKAIKLGKEKLEPGELPKVIKSFVNDFKNGKLKEYALPDKKKK